MMLEKGGDFDVAQMKVLCMDKVVWTHLLQQFPVTIPMSKMII